MGNIIDVLDEALSSKGYTTSGNTRNVLSEEKKIYENLKSLNLNQLNRLKEEVERQIQKKQPSDPKPYTMA